MIVPKLTQHRPPCGLRANREMPVAVEIGHSSCSPRLLQRLSPKEPLATPHQREPSPAVPLLTVSSSRLPGGNCSVGCFQRWKRCSRPHGISRLDEVWSNSLRHGGCGRCHRGGPRARSASAYDGIHQGNHSNGMRDWQGDRKNILWRKRGRTVTPSPPGHPISRPKWVIQYRSSLALAHDVLSGYQSQRTEYSQPVRSKPSGCANQMSGEPPTTSRSSGCHHAAPCHPGSAPARPAANRCQQSVSRPPPEKRSKSPPSRP